MISILEQLIKNIEMAEGVETLLESQLNEKKKIVSKKKKRLQQKQKAQKNVTNPIETNKKEKPKTQLIKYNPTVLEEQPEQFTQEFINCRDKLAQIARKYYEILRAADQIWQREGKDKPCPDEAFKKYQEALNGMQQEINEFLQNDLNPNIEKMESIEIQYLEQQLKLADGFLTKSEKMIDALNPELFVDPKQIEQKPLEIEDKGGEQQDNQFPTKTDNSKKKDLLTYQDFQDKYKEVLSIIEEQIQNDEEAKKVPNPNDLSKKDGPWVERTFWAFVESPVATDAVKLFMYSNPITAAIFDGKFGKLGFKDGLNWIKGISQQKRQQTEKNAEEARKNNSDKYNKNGVPKSTKGYSVNDLRKELYGNKIFVQLVNTLYNYPEVDKEDKKVLLDTTTYLNKELAKDKLDREVRSQLLHEFNTLIETVNECCDYLGWENYNDWRDIKTYGNGENEEQAIKGTKSKKEAKKQQLMNNITNDLKELQKDANNNEKSLSFKDVTSTLTSDPFNYNLDDVRTAWQNFNQQESYDTLLKYNQILECALGNETKGEI